MQKQIRFFQVDRYKRLFLLSISTMVFGALGLVNASDVFATTSTINLQISNSNISLDVFPTSASGDFASSSAATISVSTDHFSGYTLGIRAGTTGANASKLVNGGNTINSIPTALSESDYKNSANTQYNNTWGYKPNKLNSTNNSNYLPAPSVAGETLDVTSNANSNANEYTIGMGVRVAPDLTTGTYSNTFVITAVANLLSYSINYNKNTTDTVSNLPAVDLGSSNTDYVVLTSDVPTRNGYDFVGWCGNNNSETSCDSMLYSSGGNYELDQTADNTGITLYAIWDEACPANNICYKDNGANSVSSMGNQSATSNTELTLYASNFKNDGYGFAGWSTEPITGWNRDVIIDETDILEDNLAAAVSANKVFGPNANYTPGNISTKGQKLYAIWVPVAKGIDHDHHDARYFLSFQDNDLLNIDIYDESDPENIEALNDKPIGYVTALKDERDNQVYAVAKLADGKYWMIENLRLADKDSSNNDINLTSSNTHNPSLPLNNSWYYSSQQGTLTTSNHLSATTDPTATSWCSISSSDCIDQSMLANNNTTLFTNNIASSYNASSDVYSYGNYYNWYSATAGHGKYGNSYGSSFTAPGDICPVGWHLPTGRDASGEFGLLDIALGGTGTSITDPTMSKLWRSYPSNFVFSGSTDGASVSSRNSYGEYWSASGSSNRTANFMYVGVTSINPGGGEWYKYYGRMVRCVAGV